MSHKVKKDVRAVSVLLTLLLVAGIGLVVKALPFGAAPLGEPPAPKAAEDASRPNPMQVLGQLSDPQGHVRDKQITQRFEQAAYMLHAGRYDHALTALHEVLRLAPVLPEAHVNMGYTLLGLERPEAARDFFDSAIKLRPSQANAYYGLALARSRLNDPRGAIEAMRGFLTHADPADPYAAKAKELTAAWEKSPAPQAPAGDPDPKKVQP